MLTFCPNCTNMLKLSRGMDERGMEFMKFECNTCPYQFPIKGNFQVYDRKMMERKQVDDVLGGEGAWDNVDQTTVNCEGNCGNDKAYFYQLQIRSADEPMTSFYKCTNCGTQWREN